MYTTEKLGEKEDFAEKYSVLPEMDSLWHFMIIKIIIFNWIVDHW